VDDSYELLNGAGVKHQKAKEIYKEKDGLDIVIDIDPGVLKDAEVVFDWTIGTFWSKWFTLQKSFLESKHTLQEVQFLYCDATYIAHDPQQIENLLSAIATLQEVDRRPLTEMETPDPNDKADIQDWALEIVSQLLSRHPNARVEGVQNVKKLVEEDEEAGNFKEGTADKFAEFVDDLGSGEWQELMSENLSALKSQRQFKSSRKVIERAIQQLSEGKYKADFAVNYADDGSLLATLIAPFPVMIRFEREGGEVQFKELVTSICDSAFIATSFDQAKDLLKANVNLGIAAGEVADDSISKDRKDKPAQDPEDVAEDVAEDLAEDEDVAKVMKEMKEGPEEGEEIDKRIERFSNIFKSKQKRREFLHWVESNPKAATNFFSVNDDLREWLGKNYPDVHAQIAQTIYR
jgi:hypothetical protein